MNPLSLAIFGVVLMTLGVAGLFYPRRVLDLNQRLRGNRIKPAMPKLMGPNQEIWVTRISGAGFILMGLLIGFVLWKR